MAWNGHCSHRVPGFLNIRGESAHSGQKTNILSNYPWFRYDIMHFAFTTGDLSLEERGAYLKLLEAYWAVGPFEADIKKLANLTRMPEEICAAMVARYFTEDDGYLCHELLDDQRDELNSKASTTRQGNRERQQRRRAQQKGLSQSVTRYVTQATNGHELHRDVTHIERKIERKIERQERQTEEIEPQVSAHALNPKESLLKQLDGLAQQVGFSTAAELKVVGYRNLQPRAQSTLESIQQFERNNWQLLNGEAA